MRKKRARPAAVRPTRGSVHSVAYLRDLDEEITHRQSEIRAAKAAARESRAEGRPGGGERTTRHDSASVDAVIETSAAEPREPDPDLSLAAELQSRGAPLLEALDRHYEGAREHAEATASYAFAAAVEVGLGRASSEAVREAAMLHEVGQVYVPAAALAEAERDRDATDTEEFEALCETGYWLVRGVEIPEHVCDWLLGVRERYDGTGPEALRGDAIPIESRIIRAACVCHTALANPADAAYQSRQRAIEQLKARAGRQLDPRVVAALVGLIERASAPQAPEPGADTSIAWAGTGDEVEAPNSAAPRGMATPMSGGFLPDDPAARVETVLGEIVESLALDAEIEIEEDEEQIAARVEGEELGLLIGRRGQTIDAVQLLCARAAFRDGAERKRVSVDAAGYRERRRETVERQADRAAERALDTGKEIELEPMSASERKIVHDRLAARSELETFSEGDEPERRVIVAPLADD
jgi:spoIIIJ-associated protein